MHEVGNPIYTKSCPSTRCIYSKHDPNLFVWILSTMKKIQNYILGLQKSNILSVLDPSLPFLSIQTSTFFAGLGFVPEEGRSSGYDRV